MRQVFLNEFIIKRYQNQVKSTRKCFIYSIHFIAREDMYTIQRKIENLGKVLARRLVQVCDDNKYANSIEKNLRVREKIIPCSLQFFLLMFIMSTFLKRSINHVYNICH